MAHKIAGEIRRALKPAGAVLWYDFRYGNPWNPNVRGMTKRLIRRFFPDFQMCLRTITLLPPLARRLGRLTPVLYPILAAVPPLRTHYVGLLMKPTVALSAEKHGSKGWKFRWARGQGSLGAERTITDFRSGQFSVILDLKREPESY